MNELEELQNWCFSQCNDDWEHIYGIKIENIDNPGWMVKIDLFDTTFENAPFSAHSYGIGDESERIGNNWLSTKLEQGKFVGYGGPYKLKEIISVFLTWAKSNA